MNLSEGTRRLALLFGVAGAIVGGFGSVILVSSVSDARKAAQETNDAVHHCQTLLAQDIDALNLKAITKQTLYQKINALAVTPALSTSISTGPTVSDPLIPIIRQLPIDRQAKASFYSKVQDWRKQRTRLNAEDGDASIDAPSAWWYVLAPFLPIFGFALFWGGVRVVGWVIAGFLLPSSQ